MEETKKEVQKESFMERFINSAEGWVRMLMGKPKRQVPTNAANKGAEKAEVKEKVGPGKPDVTEGLVEVSPGELQKADDSVVEDIKSFKSFFRKSFNMLIGRAAATKATKKVQEKVDAASKKASFSLIYKLIPALFILIVVLLAAAIVISIFEKQNGIVDRGNGIVVETTPPVVTYQPYTESIYASDPEILRLDEDINVLGREISTTVLQDSILTPPKLDFNIKFD